MATSRKQWMFCRRSRSATHTSSSTMSAFSTARSDMLALDLGGGEAGRGRPDEEALDLVVGDVARPDHRDVGERAVADPALGAVQHPLVARALRGGAQALGGVGAVTAAR